MARTISTELNTYHLLNRIYAVDLLKVVFPSAVGTKCWSTKGSALNPVTYNSNDYVARVISLGDWTRTLNPETDDFTVTLANADGEITDIYNKVDMELAELELIRYFVDAGQVPPVDEAITMWKGYGGAIDVNEVTAEWNVHFGFRGFTQKGLRKLTQNCWKLFKDGVHCPYNGTTIGASATVSTQIEIIDTSITVSDATLYTTNDIIIIDTEEMKVTTGGSNPLPVTRGWNSTTIAVHLVGVRVFHHSCDKSKDTGCKPRRMYAWPAGGDDKRYFGGWTELVPISFRQKGAGKSGEPKFFTQTSKGNKNVMGEVIPASYGVYRLRGIPAVAVTDAREFKHALFILSEGTIAQISKTNIRMNGLQQDDNPDKNDSQRFTSIEASDSAILWFGALAQRQGYATGYAENTPDSYVNNPYLFNDSDGDGPSLSGTAALRVRIEEGGKEFDDEVPELEAQFIGRKVRTIQGLIDADPSKETAFPDPIEVAVDYLINGRFGARLDVAFIDLPSAKTVSDYCRVTITSVDLQFKTSYSGTVDDAPGESGVLTNQKRWVVVDFGEAIKEGALDGRRITISTVPPQSLTIVRSYPVNIIDPGNDNNAGDFGYFDPQDIDPADARSDEYHLVEVDADLSPIPTSGDAVTVQGVGDSDTVRRFNFNGALTADDRVDKQLALILDNANAFYYKRDGKIVFGIKKSEDLNAVDALPTLQDFGTTRNILRNDDGSTTLNVRRADATEGIINAVEVVFDDGANGFRETPIIVFDETLQKRYGEIISGTATRQVNLRQLKLVGTTSRDQALRLAALKLREDSLKRDRCTFEMTLKNSLMLEPGDVRGLASVTVSGEADKQLSKRMPYIRIESIRETSKFTAAVSAFRHENAIYDDTADSLASLVSNAGPDNPANFPENVTPRPMAESPTYGNDGTELSIITVEVTYPA